MDTLPSVENGALPGDATSLVTDWMQINQDLIDRFADVVGDHQYIHVDPVRAANESVFGGTIAHGFLVLSLLTQLSRQVFPVPDPGVAEINYGFDNVRFLAPVRSGLRIRARFDLTLSQEKASGTLRTYAATVDIENQSKPALAANWLVLATN